MTGDLFKQLWLRTFARRGMETSSLAWNTSPRTDQLRILRRAEEVLPGCGRTPCRGGHTRPEIGPGFRYSVDVLGTKERFSSLRPADVLKLIYASSGAAYGYHVDNPDWLDEKDELRGNVEFAYSDHKRQVEEMLAGWRQEHPELEQLILRPGTILGSTTSNQITALFEKPYVSGLAQRFYPFCIHMG